VKGLDRTVGLFFVLAIVWGSAFVGIEIIVHMIPPWFAAALRVGVASTTMFLLNKTQKRRMNLGAKNLLKVWAAGLVAIGIPFSFLFWSEQRVSGGLGGIINGTVPIWTSLIFVMLRRRRGEKGLDMQVIGGVLLGFVGLWLIFYPKLSIPTAGDELLGGIGLLGMAISYAIANVLNQKILTQTKGLHLETVIFHQHFVSFLYLLVLSALFESWPNLDRILSLKVLLTIIYLGIFPSALAYVIYFHLLKKIGAIKTAAVTYAIPVVAILMDFLIQGHRLEISALLGVTVILIALSFIRSAKSA
jgi:drug/metabolite transporter (DMT)-like permease